MNNSNQEQVWKIGKWVGVFLIIFLAVISLKELRSIGYVGKDLQTVNTISVSGEGEAVSIPDIASFSFSVNETGKTVKEAQDKATAKINTALDAVKKGGVAEKDIKTLSYNINPHYDYTQPVCTQFVCPPGRSVPNGYDVSQTVQVKVRDLSKAGELFGIIGNAGVKTVDSLTFSIDDIDSVKAIARADAIVKAKAKADKIADDLGVSLVRVVSFTDSSNENFPIYRTRASDVMTLKAEVAPQVPVGEQKVTASVTITYEIR
ncbi:MAG: SIMPL domain-containing protein [Candidatus Taylorbacteria bacterium]|nr:SIMPL domain-containing protein [Candidatus Taylorbacteria bacterium]